MSNKPFPNDRIIFMLSSCMILIILSTHYVLAQNDFTVTVGQNKTFTEFNYHNAGFENDPNNILPWPDQREAYSTGNTAHVSLSADPGHAGVATAFVGLNLTLNLGQYTWNEVKDWPINLTIDLGYNMQTYSVENYGSANAVIGFPSTDPQYVYIEQLRKPGSLGGNLIKSYPFTLQKLASQGNTIWLNAYCQAHSAEIYTHTSLSEITLNSIKIEFQEPKLSIEDPHTDESQYCLGDSVAILCKIKDGLGNEMLADQVSADITKPDNSKETISFEYDDGQGIYRGWFNTAPEVRSYDNEIGIYRVIIHAEKESYPSISSDEFQFEVVPTTLSGKVWDISINPGRLPKITPAKNAFVCITPEGSDEVIKTVDTDFEGRFSVPLKPGYYEVSATTLADLGNRVTYTKQTVYVARCSGQDVDIPSVMPQIEEAIKQAKFQAALDYNKLNLIRIHNIEEGELISNLANGASIAGTVRDLWLIGEAFVGIGAVTGADVVLATAIGLIEISTHVFAPELWQDQLKAIDDTIATLLAIKNDPADSNCTEIIQLQMPEPLVVPDEYNDSLNRTMIGLINAQANQSAIANAMLISFERFQGALNSGDTVYLDRQAQAVQYYADLLKENELEMNNATDAAKSELESSRDDIGANLTALQMDLSSQGLTSEELEYLRGHNLTDQEINGTIQTILDFNYTEAIGELDDFKAITSSTATSADLLANQSTQVLALTNSPNGCYIGAYVGCSPSDLSCETMVAFNQRMSKPHAIFSRYVDIKTSEEQAHFDWANRVKGNGAMPMFIYNPVDGLDAINMTQVEIFASQCNNLSIPAFVVFGEHMNGPWVPWGNQPDSYKAKFKEVAELFHKLAPNVIMCWVPYQNYGYPWNGIDYGDGYSEYYPEGLGTYGEYVDWVGLSFFYKDWNETDNIPEGLFFNGIRHGQDNIDFYQTFSVDKDKPMIAETGVFDPNDDPTAEGVRVPVSTRDQDSFKNAWIDQVYNVSVLKNDLPNLKAVCYFDTDRTEDVPTQTHNFENIKVDYRIPDGPCRDLIADPYFIGAAVAPNTPLTPVGPSSSSPGSTCGYSTVANDPELDRISYIFDWGDGTSSATGLIGSGAVVVEAHSWDKAGSFEVRTLATNSKGESSGWSNPLVVTINSPPNTPSIPSGSATGYAWTTGSFSTSSTDPDGDQVKYTFDWGDGTNSTTDLVDSGTSASLNHSWNNAGTYLVITKATDSTGATSGWSSALVVTIAQNRPPNTPSKPSGSTLNIHGKSYNYSTSATDPDGDQVKYTFDWGDGTSDTGLVNSGTNTSLAHSWSTAGTYQVKTMAMDSKGAPSGWSNALAVVVAENKPPNTPSKPSGSSSGYAWVSYRYNTSATDPDGDQIKYTFDWGDGTSDTDLVNSGTSASLAHSWNTPGIYQVKAMAMDSLGATSGWSNSTAVAIAANSPPNTPSTPSGPVSGVIKTSYNYTTSTVDPDGNQIKYTFDWGDNKTSTTSLANSGNISRATHNWSIAGIYQVKAMATDSRGAISEWSSALGVTIT
jgi:hypothetical protein